MAIADSAARAAIGLWAISWLPGLAFASWRFEHLLRDRRVPRALAEHAAIALVPLLAFASYALNEAEHYALAHGSPVSWRSLAAAAQVAVPYGVSAAYLAAALRPGARPAAGQRWLIATLIGLLSVPVLTPGLLMAQLMVFFGA